MVVSLWNVVTPCRNTIQYNTILPLAIDVVVVDTVQNLYVSVITHSNEMGISLNWIAKIDSYFSCVAYFHVFLERSLCVHFTPFSSPALYLLTVSRGDTLFLLLSFFSFRFCFIIRSMSSLSVDFGSVLAVWKDVKQQQSKLWRSQTPFCYSFSIFNDRFYFFFLISSSSFHLLLLLLSTLGHRLLLACSFTSCHRLF